MRRPFETYNVAAHNRSLGARRTSVAQRRDEEVLRRLRVAAATAPLPTDRGGLYAAVGMHSGRVPLSVLRRLALQVRREGAR